MSDTYEGPRELIRALQRHLERRGALGVRRLVSSPPTSVPVATRVSSPMPPPGPTLAPTLAPTRGAASGPTSGTALTPIPSTASTADLSPALASKQCLDLSQLRTAVAACRACTLCQTRTQTVFQDGQPNPGGIFFVGEAPGAEEDRVGIPFVGKAGALLTDIITKGMGLRRDQVTIANVLKCRPPENRDPTDQEKALCTPFLDRQIELANPAVVVPLGNHAAQHLLRVTQPISALRGRIFEVDGRKLVPTFHPAYLLRNPDRKRDCWQDIQLAMQAAGIPLPGR